MEQTSYEIRIDRYLTGEASASEVAQFHELLETDPVFEKQLSWLMESQFSDGRFEDVPNEKLRLLIQSKLQHSIRKQRSMFSIRNVAVAAAFILLAGFGGYWLLTQSSNGETTAKVETQTDIAAPAGTKAMITLSDGSTVLLSELSKRNESGVTISRAANGEIVYEGSASATAYNTLLNPRGSEIVQLVLSDGTKVWMNTESTLEYPVAFTGTQRKVKVTGEVYFEVTKSEVPFVVAFTASGKPAEVEVLGTHFNVSAYSEEPSRVTLLEGSVNVKLESSKLKLVPGQQAIANDQLSLERAPDVARVMAWKNGLFKFDRTEIQTVMRQISRWYDVEIVYPGGIPADRYGGAIRRDVSLAGVLKVLQETGGKFKIEGRKVIVER